jgi:hypothetical protein
MAMSCISSKKEKELNFNEQYFQAVTPDSDKNQPELTLPTIK